MLVQISAIIAAVAFVFLVFYLIQTLKSLKTSLDEITLTMGQMKNEVTQISSEVQDVILNTNEMAIDVRVKLSKLNHLFSSVNDVGQVIHELTSSVKQSATSLISAVKQTNLTQQTQPLSAKWKTILQGAAISYELLQKMKSKKSPQAGVTK
ncbi:MULTISPECIES: DUF948 domain-containing protein [unclassified Paenibacillus]|jgi:uncharacterized protein YoxC|uniref:DUF948 domain-containing protein n=1 Tax=unclassified Paenibacillus TaxID=185978 RepID=UPI00070C2D1A|nr:MULTISPECIES: DUF948 domain-containing protein [unclassified Paenibacillus]KQX54663.1 hypothetical protein ASD40_33965 [Paenibacillus sp. Root444D2]KRE40158.1 hypothetical protein ASG85_34800 [Paenibacillus sp. Soil724D2]